MVDIKKHEMIAVHAETKKRFKELKEYKETDDEFLNKLMASYMEFGERTI